MAKLKLMGDLRQFLRFRLPWLSAAVTPLLATEPQADRPKAEAQTQTPAQPPPVRPLGTAQPPAPQVEAPSRRTEPQATAPSRAAGETRATAQPTSPSGSTTQTADVVMPPSSSRGAEESGVAHAPVMTEAVSESPSTPKHLQTTKEESPQPPPSVSLEEQKLAAPQQPSIEAQPKPESTSQNKTPTETAIQQPPAITAQPPQAPALVTETAPNLTVATQTHAGSSESSKREDGMKVEEQTKEKELVHPTSEAGEMQEKVEEPTKERELGRPTPEAGEMQEKVEEQTKERELARPTPQAGEKQEKVEEQTKERELARPTSEAGEMQEKVEEETKEREPARPTSEAGEKQEKVEEQTKERELARPSSEAGEMQEKTQEDATKKPLTTLVTDEKKIDADQNEGHELDNSHQKHVSVDGERVPLQQGIIEDISEFVQKLTAELAKQPMGEKPVSLLALTGENRGAFMYLGLESGKKDESVYNANPDDSPEATTDGERSYMGKQINDSMTKEDSESKAYVNSNTQSIGNSIMLDCSVTGRNPGVHLIFCLELSEDSEQIVPSTKSEPIETKKAEFNITPAEGNQQ